MAKDEWSISKSIFSLERFCIKNLSSVPLLKPMVVDWPHLCPNKDIFYSKELYLPFIVCRYPSS